MTSAATEVQLGKLPILIVEDDPATAGLCSDLLDKEGYEVYLAATGETALRRLQERQPAIIVLDLFLPDVQEWELLEAIHETAPAAAIVVITADGSVNRAVAAMQRGAVDFMIKPFPPARLRTTVANLARRVDLERKVDAYESVAREGFHGIVGSSPEIRAVIEIIRNAAASRAPVLVTGESGTGKELVARALHDAGPRRHGPFVPINCASVPRELAESEFFGHVKGAFTGALSDRLGAAREATGGTLFLDEICELEPQSQAALLRFLQSFAVRPVGASETTVVDVRIVAATNRDPREEVAQGRFREDLFYRVNVIPIELPPLRRRREDILPIAERIIEEIAEAEGRARPALPETTRELLASYDWPGNVRELRNALNRVLVLDPADELSSGALQSSFAPRPAAPGQAPGRAGPGDAGDPAAPPIRPAPHAGLGDAAGPGDMVDRLLSELDGASAIPTLRDLTDRYIDRVLALNSGNVTRSARILDVNPSTLHRRRKGA